MLCQKIQFVASCKLHSYKICLWNAGKLTTRQVICHFRECACHKRKLRRTSKLAPPDFGLSLAISNIQIPFRDFISSFWDWKFREFFLLSSLLHLGHLGHSNALFHSFTLRGHWSFWTIIEVETCPCCQFHQRLFGSFF